MEYLLKVSVTLAVLLAVYFIFFKRNTFFYVNRFFLVLIIPVSFVLPMLSLPESVDNISSPKLPTWQTLTSYAPELPAEVNTVDEVALTFNDVVMVTYLVMIALLVVRFIIAINTVYSLKRKSQVMFMHGRPICVHPQVETFSFINTIFSKSSAIDPLIVRHEEIHIQQFHWIDNLIAEACAIVLWFNPFAYLLKRELTLQHEFLADAGAITESPETLRPYIACLIENSSPLTSLANTNSFGQHSIKTRILMMTKNKSSWSSLLLYGLIVPCIALLLFAFREAKPVTFENRIQPSVSAQNVPDISPVAPSAITQKVGFGMRLHHATNKMQHHSGVDFVTPQGENVMSTADGEVIESTFDELKGNYIMIRHNENTATQYYHLLESKVKSGTMVKKGDVIGTVGSTGKYSINNHLHYEVLKDGKAVDPKDYLPKDVQKGF